MRLNQIIGSDDIFPKISSGARRQARGQTAPGRSQVLVACTLKNDLRDDFGTISVTVGQVVSAQEKGPAALLC